MHIIDSAVRAELNDGRLAVDHWLTQMDAYGISHAVLSPCDEFVTVYNDAGNEQIADLVSRHRPRLSGLAVANPWYGPKALDMLKKCFDQAFSGMYIHPPRQGFRLTEAIVDPLIELCIRCAKPIYVFTGTPISAMPFQLAELARRFPEATFVMGHCGYADFSGYDAIPAAQQADNIYIETSCVWGDLVRQAINDVGAGRLLFGSGYPRSRPGLEIEKIKRLRLDSETVCKLMHRNAGKLWGILL